MCNYIFIRILIEYFFLFFVSLSLHSKSITFLRVCDVKNILMNEKEFARYAMIDGKNQKQICRVKYLKENFPTTVFCTIKLDFFLHLLVYKWYIFLVYILFFFCQFRKLICVTHHSSFSMSMNRVCALLSTICFMTMMMTMLTWLNLMIALWGKIKKKLIIITGVAAMYATCVRC